MLNPLPRDLKNSKIGISLDDKKLYLFKNKTIIKIIKTIDNEKQIANMFFWRID